MSLTVKAFDDRKAEQELKKCPKIVRDYVKLLKESNERWKETTHKAIRKMRELSTSKASHSLRKEVYTEAQVKEAIKQAYEAAGELYSNDGAEVYARNNQEKYILKSIKEAL